MDRDELHIFENEFGHIEWRYLETVPIFPFHVFINDIYTKAEHRRQGHGTALLREFCQEWPPETIIELDNVTDHDFFYRNGFQYVDEPSDNAMRLLIPSDDL